MQPPPMFFFFFSYLFFLDQGSQLCNIAIGNCNPKAKGSMHTTQFPSRCLCHEISNVCTSLQSYILLSILSSSNSPCRNRGEQKFPQWTLVFSFLIGCGSLPVSVWILNIFLCIMIMYFCLFFFFFCQLAHLLQLQLGLRNLGTQFQGKIPTILYTSCFHICIIYPTYNLIPN